ncbi:MAG: hypothetical protein N2504_03635 [candidate division WOR-3 bacterium]|nr:hypothetical protein [candidate division WOR-3 bacterium]MCX7947659.1 hypothetical protein [candidate division WOR-3 bacterium]MDW8150536.1 hypothetical protein [candidate division WOR-3 bacterium]
MDIRKILDKAQKDFYLNLKRRKISKLYQKIGEYVYEIYKSGEIIEDEKLLKLLKEIDEIYKDEN